MRILKIYITLIFLLCTYLAYSVSPSPKKDKDKIPPRIIRACCAFGYDLNLMGVPFKKITHITSVEELGAHTYLGSNNEGNGLIYTKKGGFIDIAHLRDQADWTKYLFTEIMQHDGVDNLVRKIGYEGGKKTLSIETNTELDSNNKMLLSGKIAFDLSLWHELSTWYGASYIPMMPERYSSFSVEDVYSNLLGIIIGVEALKSEKPFNEAVTELLLSTLIDLEAVDNAEDTHYALELVKNVWWSNDKRLPNKDVLIQRDTEVQTYVNPWLVPDSTNSNAKPHILEVPKFTSDGFLLTDYYTLSIDLNYKFPVGEIFPDRTSRVINQNDLEVMLRQVTLELNQQGITQLETSDTLSSQKAIIIH